MMRSSKQLSNFTFMNSTKTSLLSTPSSSNNVSFYAGTGQSLRNTLVQSISFRNDYQQLFKSSSKQGQKTKSGNKKDIFCSEEESKKQNNIINVNKNLKKISIDLSQKYINKQQNIKVYVRVKPNKQNQDQCLKIVNDQSLKIQQSYFTYDHIFGQNTTQMQLYEGVASKICKKLFQGFNGSIIAYGQTGSGKTYTIFGQQQQNKQGLIYRCISDIMKNKRQNNEIKIKCSMVQLYKECFIDMLSTKTDLKIKQNKDQIYLQGLTQEYVHSEQQFIQLIKQASKSRKIASTNINQESSRSHTILSIYIQTKAYTSKLSLIDLAGSEKVCKSGTKGETFQQTKKINYSLTCFANVINALTTRGKSQHIPFRDSKLTRILKDSLTGNFITSIIVNCSNETNSSAQTLSSLKFAERAKKIKMNVQSLQNKKKQVKKISQLKQIVNNLKKQILKVDQELKAKKQNKQNQTKILINSKQSSLNSSLKKRFNRVHKIFQSSHKKIIIQKDQNQRKSLETDTISQDGNTARNPIPSQRAFINQNFNKYETKIQRPNQVMNQKYKTFDISSLNISKSIKTPFLNSPQISMLQFKEQYSPDLSLSFSIQGDHQQIKNDAWNIDIFR